MPGRLVRPFLRDGWLVLHCLTCGVPAWFAIVLSAPGNSFGTPAYAVMSQITTEHHFATISAAVATFGLMAWFIRSNWVWVVASMVLAGWHGLLAATLAMSTPTGTGSGTYALMAAAATLKLMRPISTHAEHPHANPHRPGF
jgi:hypothetical protein